MVWVLLFQFVSATGSSFDHMPVGVFVIERAWEAASAKSQADPKFHQKQSDGTKLTGAICFKVPLHMDK